MFSLDYNSHSIAELDVILDEAIKEGLYKNNQRIEYYNIVCAFDIETTSFIEKGEEKNYTIYNSNKPTPIENNKRSIMYIWQLAINGRVIIGRYWHEFIEVINHISKRLETSKYKRLLIYVHNLAFEFQYIRHMFKWHKVFAIAKRKPIYALGENGIEYRCSYILTNYSLAKLGDQLQKYKVSKLIGDLNYSIIRTPLTILNEKELQYCINDVLVVSAYIKEQIEKEKYIYKIPLTCTGYCRRYVRKQCLYGNDWHNWRKQFRNYHNFITGLIIKDYDEYKQLKRAFQGGFTHAAFNYSMKTIENVSHVDFTSSYPFVLLSEKYPMSAFKDIDASIISQKDFENYIKYYACLFDCRLYGIKPKFDYESYIPVYKCWQHENIINNNGRVYSADMVGITINEIDLKIISACYSIDRIEVTNMKIAKKDYLPIEIIKSIITLYKNKTELKGISGKENEYLVSKGLLNSIYGMMVTDIVREDIIYNEDWERDYKDPEQQIEKYNKSRRRFLYYPWGVWCTAYARRNLFYGIIECAEDYIYSDTDSIFYKNYEAHKEFINKYNNLCSVKLKTMCDYYKLDYADLEPKTIKGIKKPLGVFDYENHIEKFKTLGAKRYMTLIDGELSITVSGVNKKLAVPWLIDKYNINNAFEHFNFNLEIPAFASGKLTHYYIDDMYTGTITDYQGHKYDYESLSGIYLEPVSYKFDPAIDYINFLRGVWITK